MAWGKILANCAQHFLGYESSIQLGKTWGMLFNAEKSEHLSITGNAQNSNSCRIDMETTKIPKVTTHKHLGITVNSTLSCQITSKACTLINCAGKIGMLKRLKRKLHPSAFKRIYTGAIRPKMEYACTVWSGRPTSKLVDLQRTFCRRHNIQLPSLQKRFDYFTLALFFKVRIHQAPNSLYKLLPPPSSSSGYTFRKISYPVTAVNRSSTQKVSCHELSFYGMRCWLSFKQWNQSIALKLLWETISNSSDSSNSCHFFSPSFLTLHARCCAALPWT